MPPVTFLIIFLSFNLSAQLDEFTCPCSTEEGGININPHDYGTDDFVKLSELTGIGGPLSPSTLNNTCLAIRGTLQIDQNYSIIGGEIRMQPGSKIQLSQKNKVFKLTDVNENDGMHGCEIMWRGITYKKSKFSLVIDNSIIQDAWSNPQ